MLCERCGEREATHHDTVLKGGKLHETHLCEVCAQQLGAAPKPAGPVTELLANFMLSTAQSGQQAASPGTLKCEGCGLSFLEFKKTGLMGCAHCYEAFEQRLAPLLERAHDGGSHHVGKVPRRALSQSRMGESGEGPGAPAPGRAGRIESLRRELASAVEAEEYERAAEIRDELASLTHPGRLPEDQA